MSSITNFFFFALYETVFSNFSSSLQSSIRAILIVHKVCLAYACNLNLSSCGEYSMLYGITDLLCTLPVLPLNLTTALRFSRKAFKTVLKFLIYRSSLYGSPSLYLSKYTNISLLYNGSTFSKPFISTSNNFTLESFKTALSHLFSVSVNGICGLFFIGVFKSDVNNPHFSFFIFCGRLSILSPNALSPTMLIISFSFNSPRTAVSKIFATALKYSP